MQPLSPKPPIDLPKSFYPKLRTGFFVFAVGALFTWAGFMLGQTEGSWLVGYASAAFFGLVCVTGAAMMFPGTSYLRLDDSGFTTRNFGKEQFIRWEDVDCFFVITQRVNAVTTNKFVGMNFTSEYRLSGRMRKVNRAIAGCEGMISEYGQKAEDLAVLMSQCRAYAVALRAARG